MSGGGEESFASVSGVAVEPDLASPDADDPKSSINTIAGRLEIRSPTSPAALHCVGDAEAVIDVAGENRIFERSIIAAVGAESDDDDDDDGDEDNRFTGHVFVKKTFHKMMYCHHCCEMLWGLIQTGFVCQVCNFVSHEKCVKNVVSLCSSVSVNKIKNPVAHCWSEPQQIKKKYCCVCRKRLDDALAVSCDICEYYAHLNCQEFAVSDCKECATFSPHRDLSSTVNYHHWREGNLPPNSKCAACKKTCWTAECLAGVRCEWCGLTAHASCSKNNLPPNCDFGELKCIVLPPGAVTVPRTELPMENILGLQKCRSRFLISQDDNSSADFKSTSGPDDLLVPGGGSPGGGSGGIVTTTTTTASHGNVSPATANKSNGGKSDRHDSSSSTATVGAAAAAAAAAAGYDIRIKVFDGNRALRKRSFRTVTVNSVGTTEDVIAAGMHSFHIFDEAKNYYITEARNMSTTGTTGKVSGGDYVGSDADLETEYEQLDDVENERLILPGTRVETLKEGKHRPSVVLRYYDNDPSKGTIKIYPGIMRYNSRVSFGYNYKKIHISSETTSEEVIRAALNKFNMEATEDKVADYELVEVLLDRGVTERKLDSEDQPLKLLQRARKESLSLHRLTRYYLHQKKDPHGSEFSLFISNLPPGYSQKQYETILLDILGKENKWTNFEVIYHEYGSLVITYPTGERAVKAMTILEEDRDKKILVLLLPNIQAHMVPESTLPLLVFVNVKSGGGQGQSLITTFRKLLNPHQVFNLDNGGPLAGLYVFRKIAKYKILVCGGDGTVGWVLSCLDNVGQDAECSSPPMSIIPLGTGNDLARVLRWGSGYVGDEDPLDLLRDVIEADEIKLDRWTVAFKFELERRDDMRLELANRTNTVDTNEESSQVLVMNNYFGIGLDAELCLGFHQAREENPEKFSSRLHNKSVYVQMGLRKLVSHGSCKDLHKEVVLVVDGRKLDLPPVEGIIILNILSWASGANPWGTERDETFQRPNHHDGMLEILGVNGVVHMGQIQTGLRSGVRIAQGGHLMIHLLSELPVQVDGEPWIQPPGTVLVLRSPLSATMLKKPRSRMRRRNTEPSISFPGGIETPVVPPDPMSDFPRSTGH